MGVATPALASARASQMIAMQGLAMEMADEKVTIASQTYDFVSGLCIGGCAAVWRADPVPLSVCDASLTFTSGGWTTR